MRRPGLILLLLCVCCLALTGFVLRAGALHGRDQARSALAVLFGDGRRLFANHFLAKADAYFHRGRYPSFFEAAERERDNYLVESLAESDVAGESVGEGDEGGHEDHEGHVHGPGCGHDLGDGTAGDLHDHDETCAHGEPGGKPSDWISRLAARFEPDRHVHLGAGEEKEMLPWVRLAVEMDPHNVDAYTVGGYWLWQMGRPGEAEVFLREGQRNNPDSYEICFELGRLAELDKGESARAVRLYSLALEKWRSANAGVTEPDLLPVAHILGRLGKSLETQGHLEAALQAYTMLKQVSLNPDGVQRLIDSVQDRMAQGPADVPAP